MNIKLKTKKKLPFEFVLEELDSVLTHTKPMFGCTALYSGSKILMILRDKKDYPEDNGVWICTTADQHESLRQDFPNMKSIGLFGGGITSWQVLEAGRDDFEEMALKVCRLIRHGDPRIGKVTEKKMTKKVTKKKKVKTKKKPRRTSRGSQGRRRG